MFNISDKEVESYKEQGFVVSSQFLSDNIMKKITSSYDEFVKLS